MKLIAACLLLSCVPCSLGQGPQSVDGKPATRNASAPLTQEQGEEILNELRLIRKALEDRQSGPPAPPVGAQSNRQAKLPVQVGWFALGSDQAPVTVVEFSDFECPYCSRFHKDTFPEIKKAYIDTGKVRFVSQEFPLEFHPNALGAALAAHCAGAQGRYWQMHDSIVSNSSDLSAGALNEEARKLALDIPQWKSCIYDSRSLSEVQHEVADGRNIGVTGTPAFLVGREKDALIEGVRIDGALPYAQFAQAIDSALAAKK